VLAPDPVICFEHAVFDQRQSIHLEEGASLVAVDWLTSGRRDRGECWDFSRYFSRLDVHVNGELRLRESLLLDRGSTLLGRSFSTGGFHCVATLVAFGENVAARVREGAEAEVGARSSGDVEILCAVSSVRGGVVLRVLGATPERVEQLLRRQLAVLASDLGDEPWARKW
jgi:urease accessory protein